MLFFHWCLQLWSIDLYRNIYVNIFLSGMVITQEQFNSHSLKGYFLNWPHNWAVRFSRRKIKYTINLPPFLALNQRLLDWLTTKVRVSSLPCYVVCSKLWWEVYLNGTGTVFVDSGFHINNHYGTSPVHITKKKMDTILR